MCDQNHYDDDLKEFEERGMVTRRQFGVLVGAGIALVLPSVLSLLAGRYELTLLLFGVAAVEDTGRVGRGELPGEHRESLAERRDPRLRLALLLPALAVVGFLFTGSAGNRSVGTVPYLLKARATSSSRSISPSMRVTFSSSTVSKSTRGSCRARRRCCMPSRIGVRGFLISCATCRAISRQAPSRSVLARALAEASSFWTILLYSFTSPPSSSRRFQVISSELQILGAIGGRALGPKTAMLDVPLAT